MFLKKDELSKYDFISTREFLIALLLIFLSTILVFLFVPMIFKMALPMFSSFIDTYYFAVLVFFLSSLATFYIIYYFCCKRKQKSIVDGLFLYPTSNKTYVISALIGIIMPLCTLPIIFNFAPHEFYAMDLAKKPDGLFYLFASALLAPLFEEVFYRGFIFSFFQSKLNSFWAVLITALFFGFSHFANIGNALVLLSLFILYGTALTLIRYFSRSLIPPIIAHYVHNLVLLFGFLIMSKL